MSDKPTVGRMVQYRQRSGSQAWLPAIVTVTEETYVAGVWADVSEHNVGPVRPDHNQRYVDAEKQVYYPAEIPPVKASFKTGETLVANGAEVMAYYVHLKVISPLGQDYPEFNVLEGGEPGDWRWPPRV